MKSETTQYGTYRSFFHLCVVLIFTIVLPLVAIFNSKADLDLLRPEVKTIPSNLDIVFRWLLFSSILIPSYFINVYLFVPKLLVKRKYNWYFGTFFLSLLAGIAFAELIELLFYLNGVADPRIPTISIIFPMTLLFGLGTSFETIVRLENEGRKQEAVEKERVSAELSFLKSQINPHFFFNTLNNIYSLAERNSDQTGKSILLLSNLMRYLLYDTNQGKILLTKEITHLEEYIALQRLRIPISEKIDINFNSAGYTNGVWIEPLIFLSFIENAFKHGISYNSKSFISITISVESNTLDFKVINSKKINAKQTETIHSGIGMANTHRRLQLLYPNAYNLAIRDDQGFYFVHLTIDLKGNNISNHHKLSRELQYSKLNEA
jgi:two-component system LytT family sensor kinase